MRKILAIDQGSTGTTVGIVDSESLQIIALVNREYPQICPKPGWVEHKLEDIWQSIEQATIFLLEKNGISVNELEAIGITNQRETLCSFDLKGNSLGNAISWQDRRTYDYCQKKKSEGDEKVILNKTGLPLDPYFSASKMRWMLDNNKAVQDAGKSGTLRFGTVDTFLIYKLTGGSFVTEPSNASRTMLMNLKTCNWDGKLLDLFEIEKKYLPEIKDSFGLFGKTKGLKFLPDGIPITGVLGDQQAALFGQAGIKQGQMKCTYGTGAFILLNMGSAIPAPKEGLLATVAYRDSKGPVYALEGSCYIAGACVQWLRDNLQIIESASAIESLARSVKDLHEMENLLFFPFFTGIGSPYWRPQAKASILGITRDSTKAHMARACLDGIALSIEDLISAMKKVSNMNIENLRVDGGAVKNNLLMSIQATISKLNIIRPKIIETT
ncbi:MAG: glycerol kinase GlpK, partial [Halobacteriovoraceae bacterium]|nr:glycerol kinase GlpK [Halobacteriovoraceae bacterium]